MTYAKLGVCQTLCPPNGMHAMSIIIYTQMHAMHCKQADSVAEVFSVNQKLKQTKKPDRFNTSFRSCMSLRSKQVLTYEQLNFASWQHLLHLQAVLLLPQQSSILPALPQSRSSLRRQLLLVQLTAALQQAPWGGCHTGPATPHLLLKGGFT